MSIEHGNQNELNKNWKAPEAPKKEPLSKRIWKKLKSPVFHGAVVAGSFMTPEAAAQSRALDRTLDTIRAGKDVVVDVKDANTRREDAKTRRRQVEGDIEIQKKRTDAEERTRTADISANAGVDMTTESTGKGVKVTSGDIYGTPWEREAKNRTLSEEKREKERLLHEKTLKEIERIDKERDRAAENQKKSLEFLEKVRKSKNKEN